MEKETIQDYINKLQEFEKELSNENESPEFIKELDKLLQNLSSDIQQNYDPLPIKVRIKRLNSTAIIPTYSKVGDAGMDLTATEISIDKHGNMVCNTGLAMEIPRGYVGLLFPRSSVIKISLCLANCVGVIDSGYRGEIKVVFKPTIHFPNKIDDGYLKFNGYNVGDRVAQIIIIPYPKIEFVETDDLSNTERGDGGFGHTGS
jgi:dUTP pyrophosphatase